MWKRLVVLALVVLCLRAAAGADPNQPAVVTRVDTGSVGVNFGSVQQAQNGQQFYVYRGGYLVGRIRLTQVQDNASTALVVQTEPDASIQVGDIVSAYAPRPGTPSAGAPQNPAIAAAPPAYLPPPSGDVTQAYQKDLESHTRAYLFQEGGKSTGAIKVPVSQLAILTAFNPGLYGRPWVVSPWLVGGIAYQTWAGAQRPKYFNTQNTKAYIQVVYWDQTLLSTYTNYYIYKQAQPLTADQAQQTRQSMLAQKGLDKNMVFQVNITNKGTAPLAVSPFNWHFYLLDPYGNRLRATRYDQALDQSISPNASVQGYVYFDRIDPNGHILNEGTVKILLDDVMGKHETITW